MWNWALFREWTFPSSPLWWFVWGHVRWAAAETCSGTSMTIRFIQLLTESHCSSILLHWLQSFLGIVKFLLFLLFLHCRNLAQGNSFRWRSRIGARFHYFCFCLLRLLLFYLNRCVRFFALIFSFGHHQNIFILFRQHIYSKLLRFDLDTRHFRW